MITFYTNDLQSDLSMDMIFSTDDTYKNEVILCVGGLEPVHRWTDELFIHRYV